MGPEYVHIVYNTTHSTTRQHVTTSLHLLTKRLISKVLNVNSWCRF